MILKTTKLKADDYFNCLLYIIDRCLRQPLIRLHQPLSRPNTLTDGHDFLHMSLIPWPNDVYIWSLPFLTFNPLQIKIMFSPSRTVPHSISVFQSSLWLNLKSNKKTNRSTNLRIANLIF